MKKTTQAAETDDLADGIIGTVDYSFTARPRKEFKPWHRPRKQFVRQDQWCYHINELIKDTKPTDQTLTYFGLPGSDLLDIRHFGSTICEPTNLKLKFLGFDRDAGPQGEQHAEFNISFDEVSKTASFHPQSEVIAYDLRDLADDSSIAWQKTLEFGPYDVVNLDLCDGIAKEVSGNDTQTYYNTISRLLTIQSRRKSPWLLFLTTRVGRAHISNETLQVFCDLYVANLAGCAEFATFSKEQFNIDNQAKLLAARDQNLGLQRIALVGLCKWLLKFAIVQVPPTTMEVRNLFGYRVKPDAEVEDMVSIAMRFNPTFEALPDAAKLASLSTKSPDECTLAALAAKKVKALFDVDDYLSSEDTIREEMIESMCALLGSARYDVAEYRAWLAK